MDTSKQNINTTENTIENNSKTGAKNLWKECDEVHQLHATIFSIENQKWDRTPNVKVALKSLDNSSKISNDFLNEIKYYISGHFSCFNTAICYGITQDPDTRNYMMVLQYYENGDLRNNLMNDLEYRHKIINLYWIIDGLLAIHDAGKVHKDFHSGNVLLDGDILAISDLGMCQPADDNERKGVFGVIPYMAPEVLRGHQYTQAADIYSFGIMMNELMSEEIAFNDIPHDRTLAVKICKGFRPKISEDTPKLIADLIIKCWDAKAENRPTAKELLRILGKYSDELSEDDSEIYSQIRDRLLNFENLPEPVNSTDYLSSFQEPVSSTSVNPISERLDCELNDLDLNQNDDE
ncbi:kinase-like domain-containing protein [Rhizophagus irregularis DAOM 181602=DAOM 197198]|nr:kinase-like domain-containing protein [Rhizophagus irregularis DAOM 181602=DAOM 197198]